jgi:hypothetical protein
MVNTAIPLASPFGSVCHHLFHFLVAISHGVASQCPDKPIYLLKTFGSYIPIIAESAMNTGELPYFLANIKVRSIFFDQICQHYFWSKSGLFHWRSPILGWLLSSIEMGCWSQLTLIFKGVVGSTTSQICYLLFFKRPCLSRMMKLFESLHPIDRFQPW